MRIVSNAMLIISGVYMALGLIYLRFWWAERARLAYLAFTISCFSYMLFAWFEMGMLTAETPEEYLFYIWWAFLPGNVGLIAFAWFAYLQLQGRKWLFWTFGCLRILTVILHLFMAKGIHFREITSIGHRTILGETLSYPITVPNPWMVLTHFCHVVLIIFFIDASVRCWQRGERRQALTFGTGSILFGTVTLLNAPLVLWGIVPFPIMVSFAILFIVVPMLYDLNYDMQHAAMLSEELEKSKDELKDSLYNLSVTANAAKVGLWSKNVGEDDVWVSQKTRELFGLSDSTPSVMEEYAKRVHPGDLEHFSRIIIEAEEKETDFRVEYRIVQPDQSIRWVVSVGRIELVNGRTKALRGATVDITSRKLAEEKARETEEQNTAIVAANPDMIFLLDPVGVYLAVHAKHRGDLVLPPEELLGKNMSDVLPKSLMDEFFRSCERAAETNEPQIVEYKLNLEGGDKWYEARIVKMGDNFLSVVRNITETKLAYEAVQDMSRKLLNAQEKERARLARELHDDLSQSLALLSIQLSHLQNETKDLDYVKAQLNQIFSSVAELSGDVRRISHELHPARLNQLGLEAALAGFCGEITAVYPLEIEFEAENLPRKLSDDISLCLYRVTQESLQNVVKHSRATSVKVSIKAADGKIHLAVSDNGNGFDTKAAKAKESLGLISIDERVRAVKGEAKVVSAEGGGTKIEVNVPLD
jgi:signal transduction histidine kinase